MAENESRQGGKYVGFGSTPAQHARNNSQGDVFSVVSQGIERLSLAAATAAQSAANVVQAGAKDIASKVMDGGYDHKVNETVKVVTGKTTEIGQKTWAIMKGVMALATQKVEEYTKDNTNWPKNETQRNKGYHSDPNNWSRGRDASNGEEWHSSSASSLPSSYSPRSWDDRGINSSTNTQETKRISDNDDGWAGWDDHVDKDNGLKNWQQSTSEKKAVGENGKSDGAWTSGGFL